MDDNNSTIIYFEDFIERIKAKSVFSTLKRCNLLCVSSINTFVHTFKFVSQKQTVITSVVFKCVCTLVQNRH